MRVFNQILDRKLYRKKAWWISLGITCLMSACTTNQNAPVREASVNPTWNNQKNSKNSQINPSEPTVNTYTIPSNFNGYICTDAPEFIGQSIGNGECVDLVKLCSNAPLTRYWKPGEKVFGNDIPAGTAIATFRRGKYPNKSGYHAAIYSHQDENGIYAWDQWHGQPVHLRYIKAKQSHKKAGNNASKYRVIAYR